MDVSKDAIIRASGIGEYVYCARAWWLRRVQGIPSRNVAALRQGQAVHERHGRSVARVQFQRRLAWLLVSLAVIAAMAALVLALAAPG